MRKEERNNGSKSSLLQEAYKKMSDLSDFRDFINILEGDNLSKHAFIDQFKNQKKKILLKDSKTVTKNQTITLNCQKKKEIIITQIVVSEKTTKIVINNQSSFEDKTPQFLQEELGATEEVVIKKMDQLVDTLQKYCKYKDFEIPPDVTTEHINSNTNAYGCMYYAISTQFRTLPVYACSTCKLDEICVQNPVQNSLKQLITKQHKKLLRDKINDSSILKTLFDMLVNPSFPISKFMSKKKIVFLLLLAEAILVKKKRANKKKNKKKNDTADKDCDESEEEEQQQNDKNFDDISTKILCLNNSNPRVPVSLSKEFLSQMKSSRKVSDK